MRALDLHGRRFGRLTVVRFMGSVMQGHHAVRMWECICDCGEKATVPTGALRSGGIRSCGCLRDEINAANNSTHGLTKLPEFNVWAKMRYRCINPKDTDYQNYGARGITVCERWSDFLNFLRDMGRRPTPQHSIERRDNDRGYSPDNCCWATRVEQNNNTRQNRYLTFAGRTLTMAQWAREANVSYETIQHRVYRGLPTERVLAEIQEMVP